MTEEQLLREAQSFLFVPGDRDDRFDKATATGADVVILDLEDAVAQSRKDLARERVAGWIAAGGRAVVRVNGTATPWFHADLAAARGALAVMLPKTEGASDLHQVAQHAPQPMPVIALIETAAGVLAAQETCAGVGTVRVALGNVDLAADLGVEPTSRPALQAARSQLVYASAAARLAPPIDGVTTAISDDAALTADARHGRELGFGAKLCIHPRQVQVVADAFRPTDEEISWADAVVGIAVDGVGVHDGHMIDPPVVLRAESILRRAGRGSTGVSPASA